MSSKPLILLSRIVSLICLGVAGLSKLFRKIWHSRMYLFWDLHCCYSPCSCTDLCTGTEKKTSLWYNHEGICIKTSWGKSVFYTQERNVWII